MWNYVILLIGFVLLVKGADYFVDGCSSVAKLLRIPSIIIGLTVVAFGTSMPEASVSITAALKGQNELSLSNVIGSNIFNLLVVAGVSAVMRPMPIEKSVLKKDFPFSIVITVALLGMCFLGRGADGSMVIGHWEGAILLIVFVVYLVTVVRDAVGARNNELAVMDEEFKILTPIRTAIYIIFGAAGIVYGGDLVVNSASAIARDFHLSETFIGLTIVALGTSLPELVTSVVAAKKGESDLAMGNVIGSNIFNIMLVLGASTALNAVTVNMQSVYDIVILIVASLVAYIFALRKKDITRPEGASMLGMYLLFFIYIVMRG